MIPTIDKTLNSSFDIIFPFHDGDGYALTPDTSIVVTVYNANLDTKDVDETAASVKDSVTGVYFHRWALKDVSPGLYNAECIATHDGDEFKETKMLLVTESDLVGVDKNTNATIQITANWHNSTGVAQAPGTSIKITIYKGGTDEKMVDAQDMTVKDTETGLYKYAWLLTNVADGTYNILCTAVDSGNTNNLSEVITIKAGTATVSTSGDIKFLDTNLIESASLSEPSLATYGGSTDIIENIRDCQDASGITITAIFAESDLVDKDIEDHTNWAIIGASCTVSTDTDTKVVGTASVEIDGVADGDEADIKRTFASVFDLTDYQACWLAVYFDDTALDSVTIEIEDSTNEIHKATVTTDSAGAAFTINTWQYLVFDLTGGTTIDYTDIKYVSIRIVNDSGGTVNNTYVDGLRFVPHVFTYEYTWTATETVNLVEVEGCNSQSYSID